MRESRTIGEWMDLVGEWQNSCRSGSDTKTCDVCVGALHPVLMAIMRHLRTQLSHDVQNASERFHLALESDDEFEGIHSVLNDLRMAEETNSNAMTAERERYDISIIAGSVERLIHQFEHVFPHIRNDVVTTAVRHMDTN